MTYPVALGVLTIVGCVASRLAAAEPARRVPADSPQVLYEGRYATGPGGQVTLGFPGVTAHLRFRGAALSMRASASSENVWFDVCVDGEPPRPLRLRDGDGDYPLVGGAAGAEHTIDLVRRSEGWRGTCTIQGYLPGDDGVLLAAAPLPARKLLFIGDSITCGELTAWQPGDGFKDAALSNARLSYGMILARHLGAQCQLVSYGGRGVIRDWQGIEAINNAPQFYERALPDDPSSRWAAARYVPDGIVIVLGQNDFSSGIPDEVRYVNAYAEFVQRVRADAPNAVIILANSPMQGTEGTEGLKRTVLISYIGEVVARFGSPRVLQATLRHAPGVPGNTHPTGADHVVMAAELEPLLRGALGW